MYYVYAEEFGCHPQDVPEIVTIEAWHRWLLWKKAKMARETHEAFRQPGAMANFTPEQKALFNWPMSGDY